MSLCVSGEASTPSGRNASGSGFSFERLGSPAWAQQSGAAPCGQHSACRLALHSARVFSQELELPPGVEVIRVTPAAGELPTRPVRSPAAERVSGRSKGARQRASERGAVSGWPFRCDSCWPDLIGQFVFNDLCQPAGAPVPSAKEPSLAP